jgi:hypothetical protein
VRITMPPNRIAIGIVDPGREINYYPVFEFLEANGLLASVTIYNPYDTQPKPDIVLASDEWCSEYSVKLLHAKVQKLPTLHIADGIVKWGNVWTNPRSLSEDAGMPMFQPILADRIACIGSFQARIFSSWGQTKKLALTGLPRFDKFISHFHSLQRLDKRSSFRADISNPKILIIVANQPGYTDDEISKARQSFHDLNLYLSQDLNCRHLNVVWRYGPRSPKVLPADLFGIVENDTSLFEALASSDYVIASPSTAALEAMSMDIPTCLIDYSGLPEFVHAAWVIRSKSTIDQEFCSLIKAPENRMNYQRFLLHDQIRMDGLATPRVCTLMQNMISLAESCLQQGVQPDFSRLRVDSPDFSYIQPYAYNPDLLFPAHPLFARSDVESLKCELGHLRLRLNQVESSPNTKLFSLFKLKARRFFSRLLKSPC